MHETEVSKWGNSLAVRIPQAVAKRAKLADGDPVTLDLATDGSIVVRSARRKYDLHQLVSRITKTNCHASVDWGPAVGKEVW
jgi:antitoxin MazE